jgi:hypothetical protein
MQGGRASQVCKKLKQSLPSAIALENKMQGEVRSGKKENKMLLLIKSPPV